MTSSDSNSRSSSKRVEREDKERGAPQPGSYYRRESGKGRQSTPPESTPYFKRESGKGRPCTPPEEPPYFRRELGKGRPSTPPEYYIRETGKGRPSTPPEGPLYYRRESGKGRPSTPPEEPPNLAGRSRQRIREKDVYIERMASSSPPFYKEQEYRRHKQQQYQREQREQQRYRSSSNRRSGPTMDFNDEGRPHSWDEDRMSGGGLGEVEGRRHGSSEDGSRSLTPVAMIEEDWLSDEDEAPPPQPRVERRRGERPPSSQRGTEWSSEGRSKMYAGDRDREQRQLQRDEVCLTFKLVKVVIYVS